MRATVRLSIFLLLLSIILTPALSFSFDATEKLKPVNDTIFDGYVNGLVDRALAPGTPEARRDALISSSLRYAWVYGLIRNEEAIFKGLKGRILATPVLADTGEKALHALRQEGGLRTFRSPRLGAVKRVTGEMVEGLIRKALDTGALVSRRMDFLDTVLSIAAVYSRRSGDDIFYHKTRRLISTLPDPFISGDERIITEFQKAMLHDNRLVMEFLVKRIEPRIEPLVEGIIDHAKKKGISPKEKELLLTTAMRFAKTYSNMKGDATFHRKIHREAFTARLGEPVRSKAAEGVHIIDIPRASGTIKNIFNPDNIIIRAGETVRWVNQDDKMHVIGTLDFPSDGHFFNPNLPAYSSFEHKFEEPGEYYYICYIHNSMVGKITVVK